jgi:hypothetical protein
MNLSIKSEPFDTGQERKLLKKGSYDGFGVERGRIWDSRPFREKMGIPEFLVRSRMGQPADR